LREGVCESVIGGIAAANLTKPPDVERLAVLIELLPKGGEAGG
jgi:hypothetical protein